MEYAADVKATCGTGYIGSASLGQAAQRQPEVNRYMNEAFENLDGLRAELSAVRDKIRPVCNENRNGKCEEKVGVPLAPLCPLAEQLRELSAMIRDVRRDIASMGDVIEL
jgi:hypothetical protein